MAYWKKLLLLLVFVSSGACAANSSCNGVIDCLKAFFTGNIGGDTTEDVIKVFEIDQAFDPKLKIISEEELEKTSSELIKRTNDLLDSITNAFKFDENRTESTVKFTTFTNWSYTYETQVKESYLKHGDDKIGTDVESLNNGEFIPFFPILHNATVKKFVISESAPSSKKYIPKLNFSLDFEDETEFNNDTSTDYPIIDYISLYEDTTNEFIEETTTKKEEILQTEKSQTLSNRSQSYEFYLEEIQNEITNESSDSFKNGSEDNEYFNGLRKVVQKKADQLNSVLDDFIHEKIEDTLYDYPEKEFERSTLNYPITTESEIDTTTDVNDPGFQFLGLGGEAIHLCKARRAFSADRTIGLPADQENYWNATFHADTFENLKAADLVVEMTSKVSITPNENAIVTQISDTTYAIKGLNPNKSVEFRVQALPGESFPFLKKLVLNGREICKEKRNWRPSLLGVQDQAVISPLVSPHKSGSYYCGRSKINFVPLVVKGQPTKEGDYPWHVALFVKNKETKTWDYACGGTIIAGKTILTAAHCVISKNGEILNKYQMLIVAGKHKLHQVDSNQYPIRIRNVIVHPGYVNTQSIIKDDLALIITEDYIQYGLFIQPICMWNSEQDAKEIIYQEYGTIVGWGSTENDTLSETLLAAPMRVIPDSLCLRSRPSFFKRYLSPNTFCAGNKNGTSACNGDSGGGLIFPIRELDDNISWYLRGVVSVGVRRPGGLCDPLHYVVFTDVVKYRQWIIDNQEL